MPSDRRHPERTARIGGDPAVAPPDELSFRIELWDAAKSRVEAVLAELSHGSIAYAAYHAAVRDYPERYLTLRQHGRILSSCNAPAR